MLITASTLAIALTAPFTGALADVLGRKRLITTAAFAVIVPTLIIALSSSVPQLVFWRFVQGLLLPPIFTVAVAYVGEELLRLRCLGWSASLFRIKRRRFLWPVIHGCHRRPGRLARRFCRCGFIHACRRADHHIGAAARAAIRSLGRVSPLGAANARPPAQSAAVGNLRRRLWRPIQFRRRVHLRKLSSGRPALFVFVFAPWRAVRDLPRRHMVASCRGSGVASFYLAAGASSLASLPSGSVAPSSWSHRRSA